jgi:hypothetical protein
MGIITGILTGIFTGMGITIIRPRMAGPLPWQLS